MSDSNIVFNDNKENEDNEFDDLDLNSEFNDKEEEELEDGGKKVKDDGVIISQSKLDLIKKLLANIKENNDKINSLLFEVVSSAEESRISIGQMSDVDFDDTERVNPRQETTGSGRIVEGVFDGENMIGPDGKQYSVPANYASKSKLVEGDILKLTITSTGTFVYKQIGPIERIRIVGTLEQDANGNFTVHSDGKRWQVLTASVTYYKGQSGDEIIILIPKSGDSKWAAVENIVRNSN